jgi:predicted dehydrogenase
MAGFIAQVGCGHWGKNLARNFAEIGVLASVTDGDDALASTKAAEHGVAKLSFDQVLADPGITGVALATPAPTHAAMARAVLEAGKHVFVEKPLALLPGDARELVALADAKGLGLMVGHLLQYHPIFQKMLELVGKGAVGEVQYIYSNRMSLGKIRIEENVLWSFAPHDISMILALAGEVPDAVTAQGTAIVTPGIADWCTCQMRFPSGKAAHVQVSWLHPFKEQRLTVIGSEGMLVFEDSIPDWGRKLAYYAHRLDRSGPVPLPVAGEANYIDVAKSEPLRTECEHFAGVVRRRHKPRSDGAEGLRVLEVLDKAEQALAAALKG